MVLSSVQYVKYNSDSHSSVTGDIDTHSVLVLSLWHISLYNMTPMCKSVILRQAFYVVKSPA